MLVKAPGEAIPEPPPGSAPNLLPFGRPLEVKQGGRGHRSGEGIPLPPCWTPALNVGVGVAGLGTAISQNPRAHFHEVDDEQKNGDFFLFWGQMLVQFFCLFSPNTLS